MTPCIYSYRDDDGHGWDLPGAIDKATLNRWLYRGLARWHRGRWEIVLD